MDMRKVAYPSLATTRTAVTMTHGAFEIAEKVLPESDDVFFFITKYNSDKVAELEFVGHWCARANEGVVYELPTESTQ